MQETQVQSLGQEDPQETGMATYSSTLAWKIPWTEKPGRLQSMGSQSQTGLSNFNLPAMQKTRIQSLEWENPLEKEMATHSSILAWKIPWTEEPGQLQSMGSQTVGYD